MLCWVLLDLMLPNYSVTQFPHRQDPVCPNHAWFLLCSVQVLHRDMPLLLPEQGDTSAALPHRAPAQPPRKKCAGLRFRELRDSSVPSVPGRWLFPPTLGLPPTHRLRATAPAPSSHHRADSGTEALFPSLFSLLVRITRRKETSRTRDTLVTQRLPQMGRQMQRDSKQPCPTWRFIPVPVTGAAAWPAFN